MIDYQNLADSIVHYEKSGFKRIEAPWTVTKEIAHITKPKFLNNLDFELKHNDKLLVASGEQSFLYLYTKDYLPKGKFQTITPCFRYENFDAFHKKYFVKNELINTEEVSAATLEQIVQTAYIFFKSKLDDKELRIEEIDSDEPQFDIIYKGVELGSYGIRQCEFLEWIYGTACAEPRLSACQKL